MRIDVHHHFDQAGAQHVLAMFHKLTKDIAAMQIQIQELIDKTTAETTVIAGLGQIVTAATGVIANLKTALDTAIAGASQPAALSPEEIAALQAIASQAVADTTTLKANLQALSDAITTGTV
jgi:hypothetical protein